MFHGCIRKQNSKSTNNMKLQQWLFILVPIH
uniref:Uncharacterized protein n=1 Tax=Ciona intestinalis TaxID=7719 RepID=F6XQQ6_CIOIN